MGTPTVATFTAREKWEAARREARYRERVYAQLVATGKMKPETAKYQIAIMEAIAQDYCEAVENERLI